MKKIRVIKVKNEDGTLNDEPYIITADANNIEMANGYDLQKTIGDINVEEEGSIAEQLEAISLRLAALEERNNS